MKTCWKMQQCKQVFQQRPNDNDFVDLKRINVFPMLLNMIQKIIIFKLIWKFNMLIGIVSKPMQLKYITLSTTKGNFLLKIWTSIVTWINFQYHILVLCLGFVTWMWQQEQSTVTPTVVTMILLNGVPLVVSVSKSIFSFMLFLEVFLHSCKWFKVLHSWLNFRFHDPTSGWSLLLELPS